MQISASQVQQHSAVQSALLEIVNVKPHTMFRVKRDGARDWVYRILDPKEIATVTPSTQMEIGPRYQDMESVFHLRIAKASPPDKGRVHVQMDLSVMLPWIL